MPILFLFFSLKIKSLTQIESKFYTFNTKIKKEKNWNFEPKTKNATYKMNQFKVQLV